MILLYYVLVYKSHEQSPRENLQKTCRADQMAPI